ncbi:MAG: DNA polymerase III subunit delta' [Steroidobacteraceae bacterium]
MDTHELRYPELPWLASALTSLQEAHAAERLSHAVLIHAPPGTGGDWLAAWIARLALCTNAAAAPCGLCTSCRRALELQHPDLTIVSLEEEAQQIRIEQVRDLAQDLALTSHQGRAKVAIVTPADALNRFAANALLKTLEEPTGSTVLILVSAQPSRLPATVRSRCQRIRIAAPTRAESLAWLAANAKEGDWGAVLDVTGEAPLSAAGLDAAKLAQIRADVDRGLEDALAGWLDPAATAERWSRSELALRLSCFERWLTERVGAAHAPSDESRELRPGPHLPVARSLLNIRGLFGLLDGVRELKSLLDTPLNKSLALEVLLRRLADEGGVRTVPGRPRASQRR